MTFTQEGKRQLAGILAGVSAGSPSFIAVGSVGSPLFTAAMSVLRYEINRTRRVLDSGSVTGTLAEIEMILPSTEPSGLMPINIREVGVFSGSPTGSSWVLSVVPTTEKTTDIELQVITSFRVL